MFQHYKKNPNGTQTVLYVQTRDAIAGLTIAINDKPLTAEQHGEKVSGLQRFIDDPRSLKKNNGRKRKC